MKAMKIPASLRLASMLVVEAARALAAGDTEWATRCNAVALYWIEIAKMEMEVEK